MVAIKVPVLYDGISVPTLVQVVPSNDCHWKWISGEPAAVKLRLKLPPVQIDPPTGCVVMEISGVTVIVTELE